MKLVSSGLFLVTCVMQFTLLPCKSLAYLWSVEEASSVLGGLTDSTTFLRRSLKTERNRYRKENKGQGRKVLNNEDKRKVKTEWNEMEYDGEER